MIGELAQQPELGLGQVGLAPTFQGNALFTAQFDVAEATGGSRRRHVVQNTARQGTYTCRQLLRHDRLGDVVVGARLQPGDQVVGIGLGGDDDDRNNARGAQVSTDLEPASYRATGGRVTPGQAPFR